MENKTTYILTKDGVAMAFEGPRGPESPYDGNIDAHDDYERDIEQWYREMETAKASALPLINETTVEWGKDGILFFEGKQIKEGEVVPLEGWKLDKVYQYKPDKNSLWWTDCHVSVWQDRTRHSNEPELAREAYRLVRSEPERNDESGETDHFYKDAHKPEESQDELFRHESALELFREFLKENEDFIAEGGEPSFAVHLLIRIKKIKNGEPYKGIPVVTRNEKKP